MSALSILLMLHKHIQCKDIDLCGRERHMVIKKKEKELINGKIN